MTDAALPIAIIGMACRLPGAANYTEFRENLRNGVDSIPRWTDAELSLAGVDPALLANPAYVKAGGMLQDADLFDADFFRITPREAELLDPQHRLFLECSWEAFEDAGYGARQGGGTVGVFAGANSCLYLMENLVGNRDLLRSVGALSLSIGCKSDFLPARVAHRLNLTGPATNVQSGCATGLVAIHAAIRSLQAGECTMALAGASSLTRLAKGGYLHHPGMIESADGRCAPFDAESGGTVGTSGVAAILLKRLDEALADGDFIHAVIRGSAVNNDGGHKQGFTAPDEAGQARVIAEALAVACVPAASIGYVEAHGTATLIGDVVEVSALNRAYGGTALPQASCALGSVKSNIGHLDASAGIAALIKTALSLEYDELYPSLHYRSPNPDIEFARGPFYVNATLTPWPVRDAPRRAGVSSFAMGGINAHLVVEQPPARPPPTARTGPVRLRVSARSPAALASATAALARRLSHACDADLPDIAYTLHVGRQTFAHRRDIVCASVAEAVRALESPEPGPQASEIHRAEAEGYSGCRRVPLPTYPFERKRYWIERKTADLVAPAWRLAPAISGAVAPTARQWLLVGARSELADRLAHRIAARLPAQSAVRLASLRELPADADGLVVLCEASSVLRHLPPGAVAISYNAESVLGTETCGLASHGAERESCRIIDVEPALSDNQLDLLIAEIANGVEARVALRGRRRFVLHDAPLEVPPASIPPGAVLVAAGLSRRGLELIEALANLGTARIYVADPDIQWLDRPPSSSFDATMDWLIAAGVEKITGSRDAALEQALDRLCAEYSRHYLISAGAQPGRLVTPDALLAELGIAPAYHKMVKAQLDDLVTDGLARRDGDGIVLLPALSPPDPDGVRRDHPDQAPLLDLLEHSVQAYPDVFSGRVPAAAVVASDRATQLFTAAEPAIARYSARAAALKTVERLVSTLAKGGRPLRILEIGGGTGALTNPLAKILQNANVTYVFTDVGTLFLSATQRLADAAGFNFITTARLDVSADPLAQGFAADSFDLVIGLDVVHVTADIVQTLAHLRTVTRPGGLICLIETVRSQRWQERIWGLETGWWDFSDALRQQSPLLSLAGWTSAVEQAGLCPLAQCAAAPDGDIGVILAERPGAGDLQAVIADSAQADRQSLSARIQACRTAAQVELIAADTRTAAGFALAITASGPVDAIVHAACPPDVIGTLDTNRQGNPLLIVGAGAENAAARGAQRIFALAHEARAVAWSWPGDGRPIVAADLRAVMTAVPPEVHGPGPIRPVQRGLPVAPLDSDAIAVTPQQAVLSLWRELLGVVEIGLDEDFYALGGDSLIATRIVGMLSNRFSVELPLERFFSATTVNDMADALTDAIETADARQLEALLSEIEHLSDAEIENRIQGMN